MKKSVLIFYFLLVVIINGKVARAQWVETNGPYSSYGGTANSLLIMGSNVFAGTFQDGVFMSSDGGTSWTPTSTGMINGSVDCMVAIGSDIFAGTENGIWMSSNDGASWSQVGAAPEFSFNAIAVTDSIVFAGSNGGVSILRHQPDGSWSAVNKNLGYVISLIIVGNNVYAGTISNGVLMSTDNGNTWVTKDSGLTRSYISSLGLSGSYLFAGTDSGAFVSTDSGTSWTPITSGLPRGNITAFDTNSATIFAGTDSGVYRSTDKGGNWSVANRGLTNTEVYSLAVNGNNLIVGVLGHTFVSTDNGTTWTASSTPFERSSIVPLIADGDSLYGADEFTFYRSSDGGSNWVRTVDGSTIPFQFDNLTARGRYVLAGLDNGVSLRSTDCGTSWTGMDSTLPAGSLWDFAWFGSRVFGGGRHGVFVSRDSGASWSPAGLSAEDIGSITTTKDGEVFAATSDSIFASTDYGGHWSAVQIDIQPSDAFYFHIVALAATAGSVFAGTSLGVFQLRNNTDEFANILQSYTSWTAQALAASDTNLFVVGGGQIYHISDSGINWGTVDDGLMFEPRSLAVSGQNLYAGTYKGGVWKRPLSQVIAGFEPTGRNLPEYFSLSQNYPNPFNPSTIITYQLPVNNHVTLRVYDVLGRLVKTLVDERENAGSYSVTFNADGLVSGAYFYRLDAGSFSKTEKMLLLR